MLTTQFSFRFFLMNNMTLIRFSWRATSSRRLLVHGVSDLFLFFFCLNVLLLLDAVLVRADSSSQRVVWSYSLTGETHPESTGCALKQAGRRVGAGCRIQARCCWQKHGLILNLAKLSWTLVLGLIHQGQAFIFTLIHVCIYITSWPLHSSYMFNIQSPHTEINIFNSEQFVWGKLCHFAGLQEKKGDCLCPHLLFFFLV